MTTRALLLCLAGAAFVSFFLWDTIAVYPFRLLVTLMHETGHAVMANLVGGSVESVTISPSEGGLTVSAYEPTFLKQLLVKSAGYVGSSIAGAALLVAVGRMRSGKVLVWGLVGWMLIVALLWVPIIAPDVTGGAAKVSGYARSDGLFTLAFIAGLAVVFGFIAAKAPVWLRRGLVVWVATLSCLAALQDIKGLFGFGLGGSDAHAMADITLIPAGFWAAVWMLMSLAAMTFGLRSIAKRRRAAARAHPVVAF